jgi:hypothetical protein
MSVTAASAAAGLLTVIQLIEAAADAKPIIDALKAAGAKGASFEELLDIARNAAVASESDAAARISK